MSIPAPKKTARAPGAAFPVTPVSAATTDNAIRSASAAITGKTPTRAAGKIADTASASPIAQARSAIASAPIGSVRPIIAKTAAPPKPMAAVSKRKIFQDGGTAAPAKKAARKFNQGVNAGPTHQQVRSAKNGRIAKPEAALLDPDGTVTMTVKDGVRKSATKKAAAPAKKAAAPAKKAAAPKKVAAKKAAAPAKKAVAKKAAPAAKKAAPAKKAAAPAKKAAAKKK